MRRSLFTQAPCDTEPTTLSYLSREASRSGKIEVNVRRSIGQNASPLKGSRFAHIVPDKRWRGAGRRWRDLRPPERTDCRPRGGSGCGKSVTALSIIRLLSRGTGRLVGGDIFYGEKNLANLLESEMQRIRGNEISMFPKPMTSLNPVITVGNQIAETVRLHHGASRRDARDRAIEMLNLVKISDAKRRIDQYPHRVFRRPTTAGHDRHGLSLHAEDLIADEPTTALDVPIKARNPS